MAKDMNFYHHFSVCYTFQYTLVLTAGYSSGVSSAKLTSNPTKHHPVRELLLQ